MTDVQRQRLSRLEPALRSAVRLGDYEKAKAVVTDIQSVLRPTGHETRLMQAKNWLFEAAMEAGRLDVAMAGFHGIRAKVGRTTRVFLEATALLAICHLRKKDIAEAEPLIAEVLQNDGNIASEKRRRQFRLRIIQRFEEEAALAALMGPTVEPLDVDLVQKQAGILLQTKTEDEIYAEVGRDVPAEVVKVLLHVHRFAERQLSPADIRYLPKAQSLTERRSLGKTLTEATKRVVWRSLCDPTSAVYKAWCTEGMMAVLDKKLLTASLVALLSGMKIGAFILASAVAALVIRMGLDVFCEVAKPGGVMIALDERD